MTLDEIFEVLPLSEKTLWKHYKEYPFELKNDMGQVNFFRIIYKGVPLGAVKYYQGRKLSYYGFVK